MHVSGTGNLFTPDLPQGFVLDRSLVATPGFENAVSAVFESIGKPALSRHEAMHALAEKYNPRYMSFLERRDLVLELQALGLISNETAHQASFHPDFVPMPGANDQGKSYAQLTAETEARARQNPWLNAKQNYLTIAQATLERQGYTPQGRELLDVLWELNQIREADPVLSQQTFPELKSREDVAFAPGKGLGHEYALPGRTVAPSALDYELDLTTVALQSSGIRNDDDEEEKVARAKAEAAAQAAEAAHQARLEAATAAQADADKQQEQGEQAAQAWFDHHPRFI